MKREYPLKPERLLVRPEKELLKLGLAKGYISLSKDGSRVTYIASGKSYSFKDPEEKIRTQTYIELIEKYKYNSKRIDQEKSPPRREPKLPADIVVYEKERDKVFIVVEIKADETEKKIEVAKREGLGNATLLDARYLWIVCGTEKFAYDVYDKPPLEELEKHRIADIPIAYGKEPKFKYKKADPEWDLSPISYNELGRKFQLCHNEIWEGGKRDPAVAFDEMSKLMFVKIWDERFTEDGKYYRFQIGTQEEKRNVAVRIKDIYKDAQEKEPDVFKGKIELPDRLIYRLVEILQDFSFTKTDLDAKGRAFEKFLGMVFRGQFGQYFTRREIVEFMVDMLEPTKDDIVIDPACGSGGFLLYTMDRVRKRAKEVYKSSPRTIEEIYWNFPRDSVFGIDNNDRIARVAMMDMVIHDDGHTNIENNNALFDYSQFSPKRDVKPNKYTLLLTNPPFGAKESNPEILKLHELGSKKKKRKSQRSEILFIERCLDLLKTGGRMGIVLPDGILTNSSLQYVRDFIERNAKILAVISLPQSAFVPAGAGVKASLLFLKKKSYDGEDLGDYPIFMVIAGHIGYDATGRPDKNELPDILKEYKEFLKGKRDFNPAFVVMKKELKERYDPRYYHPKFKNLNGYINQLYQIKTLKEISDSIASGITPRAKGTAYTSKDEGIPFIRSGDLTKENIIDYYNTPYIKKEVHNKLMKSSQLRENDLLIAIVGATIGKVSIFIDKTKEANINQAIARVRISDKAVNPYFVLHFLRSRAGQQQLDRIKRPVARANINLSEIGNIKIPMPSYEVQKRIIRIMEKAYEERKEKLAKSKEIMDSIEPYVLGELGIELPEVEQIRRFSINLNELKSGLRHDPYFYQPKYRMVEETLRKGKFGFFSMGEIVDNFYKGVLPKHNEKGGNYKVVQIKNITSTGDFDLSKLLEVNESYVERSKNIKLKEGELIVVITGATIGKAAVFDIDTDLYLSGDMIKLKFKSRKAIPFFILTVLLSEIGQMQILQHITGATNKHLSPDDFIKILIPLPLLSIQEKIAKEVQKRREKAKKLQKEAEEAVQKAKEKVEKIITGKESIENLISTNIPIATLFLSERLKVSKPSIRIKRKSYKMLDGSEKELVQQVGDGSIIKRFDKTPIPEKKTDVVCPHFLELKWATGCPYDCSWCYLKGTFRFLPYRAKPHIKDFNKINKHTQTFLEHIKEPEILNTGELADSLMYEGDKKSFVNFIVPLFESQNKHKVLFLSKSDRMKNLLEIDSHKQVITSFSLNAIPVAHKWELKAPSVERRIKAAKSLYKKGFDVRIRIDPMVPVENWVKSYIELIDLLFDSLTPERITLGSLRGLQSTINGTSDKSWVKYLSEYSNWGKKIDINLRLAMYKRLISYLKEKYKFTKVALCKETVAVWEILKLDYKKIKCNCVW